MTSANSSWVRFVKEQKAMLWRRLPIVALSFLTFFMYDVFGTIVLLQREKGNYFSESPFEVRGMSAISSLMGIRGLSWMICCVGAVILAVQGFSYLYDQQTVDFYESRPEKRNIRFFNIIVNSLIIYTIPSLVGIFLSFLIVSLYGCGATWLFVEMILTWCVQMILFFAVYSVSSLASLLAGTVITALLMNLYIFGMETAVRLTVLAYRSAYYATFDNSRTDGMFNNIFTLPPFNYLSGIIDSGVYSNYKYGLQGGVGDITLVFGMCMHGILINFVLSVVAMALAFIVYNKRKVEYAGKAVIWPQIEMVIKISAGTVISLGTANIVYWIIGEGKSQSLGSVLLTIIFVSFVSSLILESIFARNVRMAFNRILFVPVIAGISFIILFIYKSGITGYDRYIPDPKEVESAWICNYNYNSDNYDLTEGRVLDSEYAERCMFLTDIDPVVTFADLCQEETVRAKKGNESYEYEESAYWDVVLGWRMKDGRIITRGILVPQYIDPAIMDTIVGSDEFIRGVYHLEDPDKKIEYVKSVNKNSVVTFSVSTEHGSMRTDDNIAGLFMEVYRKDVLDHYNFTLASNNNPVGCVNLSDGGTFNLSWPIYEPYEHTVEFLSEEGLWNGGNLEPDDIDRIVVRNDKYDDETGIYQGDEKEYSNIKDIKKIMDASISTTYYSAWTKYADIDNRGYVIEVYPKKSIIEKGEVDDYYFRNYIKEKMTGLDPKYLPSS